MQFASSFVNFVNQIRQRPFSSDGESCSTIVCRRQSTDGVTCGCLEWNVCRLFFLCKLFVSIFVSAHILWCVRTTLSPNAFHRTLKFATLQKLNVKIHCIYADVHKRWMRAFRHVRASQFISFQISDDEAHWFIRLPNACREMCRILHWCITQVRLVC